MQKSQTGLATNLQNKSPQIEGFFNMFKRGLKLI